MAGRWIVRNADDDALAGLALAVAGDRIIGLDPLAKLKHAHPGAEIVGGEDVAVLPGFINAHHHSPGVSSNLRGVVDDALEPWIIALAGAASLPPDLAARLAGAALLRSGVTTVVDMCTGGRGSLDEFADAQRGTARGYRAAGVRAMVAPGVRFRNFLAQADGEDAAFVASLPADLGKLAQGIVDDERPALRDYIAAVGALVEEMRAEPLTDIWFGPPGPQWVGIDGFAEIAEAARDRDTRLQTHALESVSEGLEGPRSIGRGRIAALADAGALSDRLSLAHAVWASEADIEIIAGHGVAVSHNPSSNLRLRAGIAPVRAFLAANVTLGLGLDGTALGNDDDMFAEIRLAANLQRPETLGAAATTARQAFGFATRGGARLVGRAGELGEISVGARADLCLVELDRMLWPWLDAEADPLDVILARARASDVRDVMVAGAWRLRNREIQGFDLAAAGAEAADRLTRSRPSAARRAAVQALARAIHDWHRAWPRPELAPHAIYNSRR